MKSKTQRSSGNRPLWWTAVLLVCLVMVPGVILGLMAIRAADREEAFIEKQLRTALLAEVTPTVERVGILLDHVEAELDSTATPEVGSGRETLLAWQSDAPLVGVPFLFRRSGSFVWPEFDSPLLTPLETDFLKLNADFFQDRSSVEVYRNIADEYADRVIRQDDKRRAALNETRGPDVKSEAALRQQALSEFEQNTAVQKELYEEALRSGMNVAQRSLRNTPSAVGLTAEAIPSMYVTESLRFSQIIGDAQRGLIPRLVDDRMMLLFWKKIDGDRILGCAVNPDSLKARIIEALPAIATPARLLTVLDHNGRPILEPTQAQGRDWRSPFVSREISGLLPQWEAAAYLTDPGIISSQARSRTLTIWLLVALLLVSIMVGGLIVVRMLRSELRLAEQKTTFVASVSHELKTPLTSIRLFAEMLRDGRQRDPAKRKDYLGIMVSESERLTRLINNVLDFSRLRRGGKQYAKRSVEMVGLCGEIMEIQEVRLRHDGFTVEFSPPEDEAWVDADPESIKQVLLNLISNAEKYSPKEKWVRVAVEIDGSFCVISVSDHGVGIPAGQETRIFDEFYRGDDSLTATARGAGLGLTISRHIARDHGGDLVYVPDPEGVAERGSTFELRLPLVFNEEAQ